VLLLKKKNVKQFDVSLKDPPFIKEPTMMLAITKKSEGWEEVCLVKKSQATENTEQLKFLFSLCI
jgi:hypothetical protein